MNIAIIEMPAERVHKVKIDEVPVPGYVNQDEDGVWYWRNGDVIETGYLTKESAALGLAIIDFDRRHTAQQLQKPAKRESVRESAHAWRCLNCRREVSRPVSNPPGMCACGHRDWHNLTTDGDPYQALATPATDTASTTTKKRKES